MARALAFPDHFLLWCYCSRKHIVSLCTAWLRAIFILQARIMTFYETDQAKLL